MRKIIAALFIISMGAQARAFDLPAMDLESVAKSGAEVPVAKAARAMTNVEETKNAYEELRNNFKFSGVPSEADLLGEWDGRVLNQDEFGQWRAWPTNVSFKKKVYPSYLGPLFQEDSHEIFAYLHYNWETLEKPLSFDEDGASFQFRREGNYTVTFRRMVRSGQSYLVMKTDCYGGTSYAYFFRRAASKQAYTGPLPTGSLFGPLPPYFQGQLPPLQVNGQALEGAYEYTNKIIFYKDKDEAVEAAKKAAAAIRAAGVEVLAFKTEEQDGFYRTSVAFSGKKGILYTWDDDAPTAGEAAAIVERKTGRYQSEGYTILETKITQAGNKYFFFITCAKFY